jgi:hypothetical protein
MGDFIRTITGAAMFMALLLLMALGAESPVTTASAAMGPIGRALKFIFLRE